MMQPISAPNNNGGFSLIELLVALALISVVFLGLTDTSIVALDYSMNNQVREEAVRIADETMDNARNTVFDNLAIATTTSHVYRSVRGKPVDYLVTRIITLLDGNNRQLEVTVGWPSKRFRGGRWVSATRNHRVVSVVSVGTGMR